MKKLLSLSIAITFGLFSACNNTTSNEPAKKVHYTYEGEDGPSHWGDLSPEWKLCKDGKAQTPIDIDTNSTTKTSLNPLTFNYSEVPLKIINNGHTVQVNFPAGNSVKVNDKEYSLLQYHVHVPSEHKINGKSSDMELHLVHKASDGELLVVGVMINKGSKNDNLNSFFDNLPEKEGPEVSKDTVKFNPLNILPKDTKYFNYSGSLTTPACSEGVNWHLLQSSIEASEEQLNKFSKIYKLNSRPIQPLNGRVVKQGN
ncbi:MAG: carbonic anhydrase family protein [Candidatus Sericytochromatia bacterium]